MTDKKKQPAKKPPGATAAATAAATPAAKPVEAMPENHRVVSSELKSFLARITRLDAEKKTIADDIKQVFAEAKSAGYHAEPMKHVLKKMAMSSADREDEEALNDLYLESAGLSPGPLFRVAGLFGTDKLAREPLTAALMQIVPDNGSILVRVGGDPIHIFRDPKGVAKWEHYFEGMDEVFPKPVASGRAARKTPKPKAAEPEADKISEKLAHSQGRLAAKGLNPAQKNPFKDKSPNHAAWIKGWRGEPLKGKAAKKPAKKAAGKASPIEVDAWLMQMIDRGLHDLRIDLDGYKLCADFSRRFVELKAGAGSLHDALKSKFPALLAEVAAVASPGEAVQVLAAAVKPDAVADTERTAISHAAFGTAGGEMVNVLYDMPPEQPKPDEPEGLVDKGALL